MLLLDKNKRAVDDDGTQGAMDDVENGGDESRA